MYPRSRSYRKRSSLVSVLLFLVLLLVVSAISLLYFMYRNPHRFVAYNPFFSEEHRVDYSIIEPWDVVVYGTEPEGIAAAVSAARQGLSTLLISEDEELGGLFTLGWLNSLDMSWDTSGAERQLLTGGIFEEWWNELWCPLSFQVDAARNAFLRLTAAEANLTVRLNCTLLAATCIGPEDDPAFTSERLQYLKFKNDEGLEYRTAAAFFIDASADGDLMAMSGVPYRYGWEDVGRSDTLMASTLVFEVDGVDWNEVVAYARGLNDPRYGANQDSAWAYWEIVQNYRPTDTATYLRGLNLGRQSEDWSDTESTSVLINALLLFDVDVLDRASKAAARERGEAEARLIVDFLRREAPGFADAVFVGSAPKLYVRESRHLIGISTLTLGDIISERHFSDEIAMGAYPVDLQAVSIEERERTLYAPQAGYGVPLGCLIPKTGPNNLFVVGRAASFTSEAHGSARVVPLGMVCGEAAGIASAYAAWHGYSDLRLLAGNAAAVSAIQEEIIARGGYLRPIIEHSESEAH